MDRLKHILLTVVLLRAGESAQHWGASAALTKVQLQVPTWQLTAISNCSSKEPDSLLCSPWVPGMHVEMHGYHTCREMFTHTKQLLKSRPLSGYYEPENSNMPFVFMANTQNLNINYVTGWLQKFNLSKLSEPLRPFNPLTRGGTCPGLVEVMRWDIKWKVALDSLLIMLYTPELSEPKVLFATV